MTSVFRGRGPIAALHGYDREPHNIRVADAPQITNSWPVIRAWAVSYISVRHKKLGGHERLSCGLRGTGAKLAPSAISERLSALGAPSYSDFLDLRPMTQTPFPAAR